MQHSAPYRTLKGELVHYCTNSLSLLPEDKGPHLPARPLTKLPLEEMSEQQQATGLRYTTRQPQQNSLTDCP